MASDFDILLGVDLTSFESKIEDSINHIGDTYKLKLKAEITNENELSDNVKNLVKILSALDVDLGLGGLGDDIRQLKQVQNIINSIDNTDVGDGISANLKEAKKDAEALTQSYQKLMNVTESVGKKNKTTTTTGNKYNKKTEIVDTNSKNVEKTDFNRNFTALEQYQEKAFKMIDGFTNVAQTKEYASEIDKLVPRVAQLMGLLESGNGDVFEKELSAVQGLITKYDTLENSIKTTTKVKEQQAQSAIKWENKLADVERQGYGNYQSVLKLKKLVNSLTEEEIKDTEKLSSVLTDIESQYAKIQGQSKGTAFGRKKTAEVEKLQKRTGKNLDGSLLDASDLTRMDTDIHKIFDADTVLRFENAVRRVIQTYDELLVKQSRVIEQKKLEAQAEKDTLALQDRLKQMDDERARLQQEQLATKHRISQNTSIVDSKSADIGALKTHMVDSGLIDAQQFNAVEAKLQEIGRLAKSEFANIDLGKELGQVDKLMSVINTDYEKMTGRQKALSESTQAWRNQIQQIQSGGLVDVSEFTPIEEKIKNLTIESNDFEQELKAVERQMKAIDSVANQRKTKQDDISVKKYQNTNKADDMSTRGLVPQSMINEFKALNDMLDFSSSKQDIASITRDMQILTQLEEDIKRAGKEESKIRSLIEQAQLDLTRATDKYKDSLDLIVHNSNRQLQSAERINEVEMEAVRIQEQINQLKENGRQLSYDEMRGIQQQITAVQRLAQAHRDTEAEDERRAKKTQQIKEKFESNSYRAKRGFNKNSKELSIIQGQIDNVESMVDGLGKRVGAEFWQATDEIEQAMNKLNKTSRDYRDKDRDKKSSMGGQLANALVKVPIWVSAMGIVYGTMNQVAQGFQMLLDVDKAMINLQKVTEVSRSQLEDFKNTASSMGKELGVMSSEVIKATTEYQKLGYTLQQSTVLSENTILMANVGDMSIPDANANMVSAIKGFGIEVDTQGENVRHIVDMYNEVANKYAIDTAGIGEALKRSSAVLKEAGNSIEQSVALVTAANTTIQDPNKVGNALKTVSMRLRGVSEDGSAVATLVPDIEQTFERLNKELGKTDTNKLTLMKDKGTFKSTYEIMQQIHDVWGQLSDIEQANLIEKIGGKEQGSIVASMIQNWSDAIGSYETALNSAGSGQREFNNYMDGFQYKIGQLKNALEHFWVTLLDDKAIKNLIDSITALVEVMTKLVDVIGGMPIALGLVGVIILMGSEKFRTALMAGQGMIEMFKGMGTALLSFGKLVGRFLGWLGVVVLAVQAVGMVWDLFHMEENARKDRIKQLDEENGQLRELTKNYDELDKKYKDKKTGMGGVDKYVELEKKGSNRNLEEERQYGEIQQYIIDQMPEMIKYYDEHQKAVLKSAEEIRKLNEEKRKELLAGEREQFNLEIKDADFSSLQKAIEKVRELKDEITALNTMQNINNMVKDFMNNQMQGIEFGSEAWVHKLEELNNKIDALFGNLSENQQKKIVFDIQTLRKSIQLEDGQDINSTVDGMNVGIEQRTKKFKEDLNKADTQMNTDMKDFKVKLDKQFELTMSEMNIKPNTNEFQFAQLIKEGMIKDLTSLQGDIPTILANVQQTITSSMQQITDQGIDIASLLKGEDPQQVVASIDGAIAKLKVSTIPNVEATIFALEQLKKAQLDSATGLNKIPTLSFDKNVFPLVEQYKSDITDLDSAYRQLSDGQELSAMQTMDLVAKHPQLLKSMEMENGVLKLSAGAIKEVAKLREDTFKRSLETEKQTAINAQHTADAVIASLLEQAKAYSALQGIKEASIDSEIAHLDDLRNAELSLGPDANDYHDEYRIANGIKSAVGKKDEMDAYIKNIEAVMGQDLTSNLGSLTGGGGKDKAKELQDAYYVADEYKKRIDSITLAIAKQQSIQKEYAKTSDIYRNALQSEIDLHKQKKQAIYDEIASLKQQVNAGNIRKTGVINITKDDNKTARAKQAEIQQEVDNALSKIKDLEQEALTVGATINDLKYQYVESMTAMYDNERTMLEDDIAYQEYAMKLYDASTEKYRQYSGVKLDLLKQQMDAHQQELDFLEKEAFANTDLNNQQINELYTLIRQKRKTIYEMAQTIQDVEDAIVNSYYEEKMYKYTSEMEKYAREIQAIEDKIKYNTNKDKDDDKHIAYLRDILSLRKGEVADIQATIKELYAMKERHKDNLQFTEKITAEIKKWEDDLRNAQNGVKDVSQEIKDAYDKLANDYVDMYKQQLELMKQAEEDAYNKMMELEQKKHEQKLKNIDKEMQILQDAHDKQIEMIDREEAKRSYGNDVDKMTDEITKLKQQIDTLSLDDSYEAKAKKAQLVKELTDKELELAEKQHGRQIDLTKQELDDNLEAEKKKLDARKEGYDEDYQNWVDVQQKMHDEQVKYWEDELNNERKFAQLRQDVLDGHFDEMIANMQTWSDNVSSQMGLLGDNITLNFTDKIEEAVKKFKEMKNLNIGGYLNASNPDATNRDGNSKPTNQDPTGQLDPSGNVIVPEWKIVDTIKQMQANSKAYFGADDAGKQVLVNKNQELGKSIGATYDSSSGVWYLDGKPLYDRLPLTEQEITVAKQMKANSQAWANASNEEKQNLVAKNQQLGNSIGATYDSNEGVWYKNGKHLFDLIPMKTGGFTGDWSGDGGKLAILHKKELVLNDQQTQHILSTAKILDKLKGIIPNLDIMGRVQASMASVAPTTSSEVNEYNITVQIDNMNGDKNSADLVANQIMNKIKRTKGGRF